MEAAIGQDQRAGIQLYLNQDYAGAEAQLAAAVKAQPAWAEGWSYLGYSQYMQQKLTEAASSLERAVMLDQESAEARFGLGLVWAAMKRVDAAIACWDETLRLKPGHADAKRSLIGGLLFRAQTNLDAKDYDRAEADMERAIKIDRTQPQAVVALVNHFVNQGMTARATKTLQEALAYLKDDPHIQALAAQLKVHASKDAQIAAQDLQAKQQVQRSQEVPCPACKRPIMEWAAICPHCNTQIKALPSTFAGRQDAVSAVEWQDVAFYVFASLWILANALSPISYLIAGKADVMFSGFAGFANVWSILMILVGIGMLFKQETLMYIGKILCYLALIFWVPYFAMSFFAGIYIAAAIGFFVVAVTCFMIYLLNWQGA